MPSATTQVERQIEQMVKFIRQEAEEKSNEIKVSAEEVSHSLMLRCHATSATGDGATTQYSVHRSCRWPDGEHRLRIAFSLAGVQP